MAQTPRNVISNAIQYIERDEMHAESTLGSAQAGLDPAGAGVK